MSYKNLQHFSVKSVLLKATLKKPLSYNLYPPTEFSDGIWNVAIVSLSYSSNQEIQVKDVFSISCNFVKGQKISTTNEIESYNQPFTTFLFEGTVLVKTIYFETRWFHMNALSNELKFLCKNETNAQFQYNASVLIQVLFQRIV